MATKPWYGRVLAVEAAFDYNDTEWLETEALKKRIALFRRSNANSGLSMTLWAPARPAPNLPA